MSRNNLIRFESCDSARFQITDDAKTRVCLLTYVLTGRIIRLVDKRLAKAIEPEQFEDPQFPGSLSDAITLLLIYSVLAHLFPEVLSADIQAVRGLHDVPSMGRQGLTDQILFILLQATL